MTSLAFTGSDVLAMLMIGLLVLLAGALLIALGRRRPVVNQQG